MQSCVYSSPLGTLLLQEQNSALTQLQFVSDSMKLPLEASDPQIPSSPLLHKVTEQLGEYFQGTRTEFNLPLAPQGSPFQQRVWAMLQQIPYATTWSYAQLAHHIGGKNYARAVGNANGKNPLPIIIPCHRVIAHNGALGGFSSGLDKKIALLKLEGLNFQ